MQRYRHYGTSYPPSPASAPVEEIHAEEEEEEEVYEEEAEPLIQEEAEPVVQETGRIFVGMRVDPVWFGSYLAWFGLVRMR